jgi:HAD superfamily hydrolase (TIGR01490 family)
VTLAIFDLDNTLIAGDSDHSWGEFLVAKKLVDAAHYSSANDAFYEAYKNGTLDIRAYLEFSLAPLTQHSMADLAQLQREFMRSHIEPMMLPKAKALLAEHRARGDYLLIITATNGFVTRPIGEYLGVDDLLATDPEIANGAYTGRFTGTPCFQAGKVTRLQEWLSQHQLSLEGAFFYSDSINDLPLLEAVANPIAVNPDERLQAIATARNWKIMDLRG